MTSGNCSGTIIILCLRIAPTGPSPDKDSVVSCTLYPHSVRLFLTPKSLQSKQTTQQVEEKGTECKDQPTVTQQRQVQNLDYLSHRTVSQSPGYSACRQSRVQGTPRCQPAEALNYSDTGGESGQGCPLVYTSPNWLKFLLLQRSCSGFRHVPLRPETCRQKTGWVLSLF